MENDLPKKRRYTNYKLSEKGKEIESAPSQICKSANLAETSLSGSGSFQVEIEYALVVATNEHLVKSAKEKYEEGCDLIKLDDPNTDDNVRKEHAVFYLYKTLMDSKCIADCGNTKIFATSSSAVALQVSDPDNTNNLVTPSSRSAVALSSERNGCEEHNFAVDSSLYQVVELVDGMVTESGVVTDQALENQANSMTNRHNFCVKQELQSCNEENHPAPLNFCPASPKPEHPIKTEQNQSLPTIKLVQSLRQPVVEQHQNGGLSQAKGLPTPCPQLIAHHDTYMEVVDDRLENNEKSCSTIDHVSVKKEMEHDEYYTHNIVPQPVNMENQTSDIITSVQLEENVARLSDSKGRNGKMEGKKESQKGKMTSDEREVVIWNRQNTSTEVAELDDHGLPTPCPQLIAHHDTGMEALDDRLENNQTQNVTNTVNNINHVNVKEEPESDDGYTGDLPSQSANTFEGNMENERSDIIISGKLEENCERVIESGGKSDKMEEKQKESHEVEMLVEEDESVCQKQENLLSNIADKKEQAENMSGKKGSDSKRTSTEKPQGKKKNKQGKFQCDICGYTVKWKSHFILHERIHTKEKPFMCEVCGYSAYQNSTLTVHKLIHTKEKTFVCDVCGHSTNRKASLARHMRTHSGATPFKCTMCSIEFTHKSALVCHITTHHVKNAHLFRCRYCEYSNKNKQCTKNHEIRIHTKKYPHECNVCKVGYIEPRRLARHTLNKHKQKLQKQNYVS